MKIKQRALEKYAYLLSLTREDEPRPLLKVAMDTAGKTALECFHLLESTGVTEPCREPEILERYLQGKAWHGVTVKAVAEDYAVNRLAFSEEIKSNYPAWVAHEIFQQAKRMATAVYGYVPTFIRNEMDFSEPVRP